MFERHITKFIAVATWNLSERQKNPFFYFSFFSILYIYHGFEKDGFVNEIFGSHLTGRNSNQQPAMARINKTVAKVIFSLILLLLPFLDFLKIF